MSQQNGVGPPWSSNPFITAVPEALKLGEPEHGHLRPAFFAHRRAIDGDEPSPLLDRLGPEAGYCPVCCGNAMWTLSGPECQPDAWRSVRPSRPTREPCPTERVIEELRAWWEDGAGAEVFPLLSFEHLLDQPDPEWLIDGLIPEGLSVLYGSPSTFKSFLALDWALCLATGRVWNGHKITEPGHVIYVAAEGRGGLKKRVLAWWEANDRPDMSRIHFLPEAVNLLGPSEVALLKNTIEAVPGPVKMIVVDTMARSMVGGDENSAKEVGQVIEALDGLKVAGKLVVHHTGKNGSERGSSALRGAADLMILVRREENAPNVEIACEKAKDFEAWATITMRRELAEDSLVLAPVPIFQARLQAQDELRERVLAYVREHGPVSKNKIEKGVGGKTVLVRQVIDQLRVEGLLDLEQTGQAMRCSIPRPSLGDEVGTRFGGPAPDDPRPTGSLPRRGPRGDEVA